MSFDQTVDRWPPSYDAEALASSISDLINTSQITKNFFVDKIDREIICQGDVVKLSSLLPHIDRDGDIAGLEGYEYWMVIGNTCDISRDINVVAWSQIVPLVDVGLDSELTEHQLSKFRRYEYSRRFYVPGWASSNRHYMADFLMPVTIHKLALKNIATVEARLHYYSWILLNSCIVRFIARDDGRNN